MEDRCVVNTDGGLRECSDCSLKSSREDMARKSDVLLLHYKIPNSKLNMIRT